MADVRVDKLRDDEAVRKRYGGVHCWRRGEDDDVLRRARERAIRLMTYECRSSRESSRKAHEECRRMADACFLGMVRGERYEPLDSPYMRKRLTRAESTELALLCRDVQRVTKAARAKEEWGDASRYDLAVKGLVDARINTYDLFRRAYASEEANKDWLLIEDALFGARARLADELERLHDIERGLSDETSRALEVHDAACARRCERVHRFVVEHLEARGRRSPARLTEYAWRRALGCDVRYGTDEFWTRVVRHCCLLWPTSVIAQSHAYITKRDCAWRVTVADLVEYVDWVCGDDCVYRAYTARIVNRYRTLDETTLLSLVAALYDQETLTFAAFVRNRYRHGAERDAAVARFLAERPPPFNYETFVNHVYDTGVYRDTIEHGLKFAGEYLAHFVDSRAIDDDAELARRSFLARDDADGYSAFEPPIAGDETSTAATTASPVTRAVIAEYQTVLNFLNDSLWFFDGFQMHTNNANWNNRVDAKEFTRRVKSYNHAFAAVRGSLNVGTGQFGASSFNLEEMLAACARFHRSTPRPSKMTKVLGNTNSLQEHASVNFFVLRVKNGAANYVCHNVLTNTYELLMPAVLYLLQLDCANYGVEERDLMPSEIDESVASFAMDALTRLDRFVSRACAIDSFCMMMHCRLVAKKTQPNLVDELTFKRPREENEEGGGAPPPEKRRRAVETTTTTDLDRQWSELVPVEDDSSSTASSSDRSRADEPIAFVPYTIDRDEFFQLAHNVDVAWIRQTFFYNPSALFRCYVLAVLQLLARYGEELVVRENLTNAMVEVALTGKTKAVTAETRTHKSLTSIDTPAFARFVAAVLNDASPAVADGFARRSKRTAPADDAREEGQTAPIDQRWTTEYDPSSSRSTGTGMLFDETVREFIREMMHESSFYEWATQVLERQQWRTNDLNDLSDELLRSTFAAYLYTVRTGATTTALQPANLAQALASTQAALELQKLQVRWPCRQVSCTSLLELASGLRKHVAAEAVGTATYPALDKQLQIAYFLVCLYTFADNNLAFCLFMLRLFHSAKFPGSWSKTLTIVQGMSNSGKSELIEHLRSYYNSSRGVIDPSAWRSTSANEIGTSVFPIMENLVCQSDEVEAMSGALAKTVVSKTSKQCRSFCSQVSQQLHSLAKIFITVNKMPRVVSDDGVITRLNIMIPTFHQYQPLITANTDTTRVQAAASMNLAHQIATRRYPVGLHDSYFLMGMYHTMTHFAPSLGTRSHVDEFVAADEHTRRNARESRWTLTLRHCAMTDVREMPRDPLETRLFETRSRYDAKQHVNLIDQPQVMEHFKADVHSSIDPMIKFEFTYSVSYSRVVSHWSTIETILRDHLVDFHANEDGPGVGASTTTNNTVLVRRLNLRAFCDRFKAKYASFRHRDPRTNQIVPDKWCLQIKKLLD